MNPLHALCLSALTAVIGPASAQTVLTGDTVLTADVLHAGASPAFVIGAPNITIDLNGHTVRGDGTWGSVGFGNFGGHAGVTIRNGRIENFEIGFLGLGAGTQKLTNLVIVGMGWFYTGPNSASGAAAIGMLGCDDVTIQSVVASNGVVGFGAEGCRNFVVERSRAYDCYFGAELSDSFNLPATTSGRLTGLRLEDSDFGVMMKKAEQVKIEHCLASGCMQGFAIGNSGSVVKDITVENSQAFGCAWGLIAVRFGPNFPPPLPVAGLQIRGVHSHHNVFGMSLVRLTDSVVVGNRCNNNDQAPGVGFGIALFETSSGNLVADNALLSNGIYGIGLMPNLGLPPAPGPTGNTVRNNVAKGHQYDLFHSQFATGNTWAGNIYRTSSGSEIQ